MWIWGGTRGGVALDNREADKDVNEAVATDGDEDTRGDSAGDGDTNGAAVMDEDSAGDVDRNASRDRNGDVAVDVAGDVAGGFSPPTTSTLPHGRGLSSAPPHPAQRTPGSPLGGHRDTPRPPQTPQPPPPPPLPPHNQPRSLPWGGSPPPPPTQAPRAPSHRRYRARGRSHLRGRGGLHSAAPRGWAEPPGYVTAEL